MEECYPICFNLLMLLISWVGTTLWITQLVVDATVRKCGIATQLLRTLKQLNEVTAVGLASSHPASVTALENCGSKPAELLTG